MTDDHREEFEALLRSAADDMARAARKLLGLADMLGRGTVVPPVIGWAAHVDAKPLPVPDIHIAVGPEAVDDVIAAADPPPECPGEHCLMCNGQACNLCGAGCWNNAPEKPCEHDVVERHEALPPPGSHPFAAPIPPAAPAVARPLEDVLREADEEDRAAPGGRNRKPARAFEPSVTSWLRVGSERMPLAEQGVLYDAYIAACPARKVKPGDRDFVRWVRGRIVMP